MKYRPNLYLSDSIEPTKVISIKKKLEENPLFSKVVLITLSKNDSDQLDIFEAKLLIQPVFRDTERFVVGITKNKEEAVQIIEKIVRECLESRGDCNLKEFLAWEE